jgi:hypothetical protein
MSCTDRKYMLMVQWIPDSMRSEKPSIDNTRSGKITVSILMCMYKDLIQTLRGTNMRKPMSFSSLVDGKDTRLECGAALVLLLQL